jgi:hypothetical protein
MSIIEPGYFDKDGRHRQLLDVYFVYTAFCPAHEGHVLVKVGISKTPYDRLASIHGVSPYPIELAAFCMVGDRRKGVAFEQRMIDAFPNRTTRGEWIDCEDTEEGRKYFAKTCGEILRGIIKKKPEWKTVTGEQLREYIRLEAKNRRKFSKGNKAA